MKLAIQIGLAIAIIVLAYLVYNSIDSRIEFEKISEKRRGVVIERLKDIRAAQIAYKTTKGEYAKDFDRLLNFIKNEKMPIIRQIGDIEDSAQVAQGLVTRDTILINVRDTVFSPSYLQNRVTPLNIDSLPYVPFSGGEKFFMDAGEITKNNVKVPVFEAFASNKQIYKGLDAQNYDIKMNDGLRVGSMTEPSTSGNWE